ncbi:MAG: DUF421 domain-containing protein [Syntrophomonadaceae bacterium]|nr:DUF421 domain-containing protein [Syntrophomonadaceae bacterium]
MVNILIRTIILYLVVLFILRVMGKGDLSKMDPFQVVVLFMIAELAALPIETPDISVFTGLTALLTLLLLDVVISSLSQKCQWFKNLVNGKASILVEKGVINEKEMKRLRINFDDLSEQLRIKNYPSIADLDYVILEANGDMSVIPKPEKNPVTREDMGIQPGNEFLPLIIIADGILYKSNLKKLAKDEAFLKAQLSIQGITDYSQVLFCFSDETGMFKIYPKSESTKGWDIQ